MKQKRLIAWTCKEELYDVFNWLYSSNPDKMKLAVDIVEIWTCRVGQNKVPRAIIATASLIRSKLSNDVQAIGMAVLRFVANLTGEEQDRINALNMSVHTTAQRVGIPEWMVTIRHDLAHGMFPSLPLLLVACDTALDWLKRNFWTEQMEAYEIITNEEKNSLSEIENTLQSYMKVCFECLKDCTAPQSNRVYNETINQLRPFLKTIETYVRDSRLQILMNLLLQPGYLIPTSEQFQALGLPASPEVAMTSDDIPKAFADLWFPLLLLFKRLGLLNTLIEKMILSLTSSGIESDSPRQKILMCWCRAWMKAFEHDDVTLSNALSITVKLRMNWPQLFSHIVKVHVCKDFLDLANMIVEHHIPKFTSHQKEKIYAANRLYLGIESTITPVNGDKKDTLVSSKSDSESTGVELFDASDDSYVDWMNYPLGSCPNYSASNSWKKLVL